MTSSNRILVFLFRAWGCLKRSMSDGLNCLVASFTSWWNVFQGLVMFYVFVSLSFLKMLNVFQLVCLNVTIFFVDCCVLFLGQHRRILCVCARGSRRECWTTKMNKISNVTKISVAILSISHRSKHIFVETSHHQDVWPLCDERWTPLAGLRGLSFSIKNGVDLGACSKEVLISACSTWSVQREY